MWQPVKSPQRFNTNFQGSTWNVYEIVKVHIPDDIYQVTLSSVQIPYISHPRISNLKHFVIEPYTVISWPYRSKYVSIPYPDPDDPSKEDFIAYSPLLHTASPTVNPESMGFLAWVFLDFHTFSYSHPEYYGEAVDRLAFNFVSNSVSHIPVTEKILNQQFNEYINSLNFNFPDTEKYIANACKKLMTHNFIAKIHNYYINHHGVFNSPNP